MDQTMEMILTSRLVVADLTNERPNVYFELDYARGLGKPVITIARRDTTIHFDVKDWTYIPYVDSRTLERDLKERLQNRVCQVKQLMGEIRGNESDQAMEIARISVLLLVVQIGTVTKAQNLAFGVHGSP
jgi:hypothetical protein